MKMSPFCRFVWQQEQQVENVSVLKGRGDGPQESLPPSYSSALIINIISEEL